MRTLLDEATLREMGALLDDEDRDEMAIPSLLHGNPALRWMAWRRLHVLADVFRTLCPPEARVMDYGCGTGVLFETLLDRSARVFGVDLVLDAARLLVERQGHDRVELIGPDQAEQYIAPGSLDLVVAAEVLEHVEDLGQVLALFRTLLASTGKLLVSLPTENRLYRLGRRLAGFDGHYHVHNAHSIDRVIRAAGWRRELRRSVPARGPLSIYHVAVYTPR